MRESTRQKFFRGIFVPIGTFEKLFGAGLAPSSGVVSRNETPKGVLMVSRTPKGERLSGIEVPSSSVRGGFGYRRRYRRS